MLGFSVRRRIRLGPLLRPDRGASVATFAVVPRRIGEQCSWVGARLARMVPRELLPTFVSRPLLLSCMAGLLLTACSSDGSDSTGSSGGTTTGMGTSTGATTGAATTTGAGPTSNGSMSANATTGSSSTGAATTTGAGPVTTSSGNTTGTGGSG